MRTVLNRLNRSPAGITLFFLLFLACSTTHAQTWSIKQPIPNTPTSGRWSPMCFSLNNKIYVGGGYAGNFKNMKDFWEYNPQTDQWTQKKDLPAMPDRTAGIGFAANGKGYIGLGSIHYNSLSSTFLDDLWEYDPATDDWTQKASIPDSGRHHSACFVVGNKAYVVGGTTGWYPFHTSNDLWQYDVITDTWTAMAPYPATFIYNAMAFAIGTDGYVVGGNVKAINATGTGDEDSATYKYNTLNNTWTRKANYCRRAEAGVGFALGGQGYVGLGTSNDSAQTLYYEEFCRYNPTTDHWDSTASFPNIAREYAIAAVANNKAYVGGGFLYLSSEIYKNDWAELTVNGLGIAPTTPGPFVSIYPNPVRDQLHISSTKSVELNIANMLGQRVRKVQLGPGNTSIDVAALPAGMYIAEGDGAKVRFLIQH